MPDLRLRQIDLGRDVDRLSVDDQAATAFLTHLSENKIKLLSIDLEHRRAQLDLTALGQRQYCLQDLGGRSAWSRFARARAVRFADRREQQVQVAGDVGHCADG